MKLTPRLITISLANVVYFFYKPEDYTGRLNLSVLN